MANTIKVTHEVSDQFIWDIMVNTVECSSIQYWAMVTHIIRDEDLNIHEFQVADKEDIMDLIESGKSEEQAMNDEDAWYVVDKDAVLNGINKVLNGVAGSTDAFQVDWSIKSMIAKAVADDDADIDAIGCDVIIQAALFDEIVYG